MAQTIEERRAKTRECARRRRAEDPEGVTAYQKAWREKNPDKVRAGVIRRRAKACEWARKWRENNREKCRAQHREDSRRQRAKNGEAIQEMDAARRYDISIEEYRWIQSAANGLCAICGRPEMRTYKSKTKRLVVDHCHATGRVRGMLCHSCNTMLGMAGDRAEVLQRGIEYLTSGGALYCNDRVLARYR